MAIPSQVMPIEVGLEDSTTKIPIESSSIYGIVDPKKMPQSESSLNVHGFCSNLYSMSWTCAIEATLLYFVMGFVSVFYPLWRYSPVNEQLDRLPARHGMDLP